MTSAFFRVFSCNHSYNFRRSPIKKKIPSQPQPTRDYSERIDAGPLSLGPSQRPDLHHDRTFRSVKLTAFYGQVINF